MEGGLKENKSTSYYLIREKETSAIGERPRDAPIAMCTNVYLLTMDMECKQDIITFLPQRAIKKQHK